MMFLGELAFVYLVFYAFALGVAWVISKIRRQPEFKPNKKLLYVIAGILTVLGKLPDLARQLENLFQ